MGTRKEPKDLNKEIARILEGERKRLGHSYRKMSEISGLSRMSVKRVLDGDRAMSVDAMWAISFALGLLPSEVVREAETVVDGTEESKPSAVVTADWPASDVDEILDDEDLPYAALNPGYDPEEEFEQ